MKNICYVWMLFASIVLWQACEKDPAFNFKDDGKIYFKYPKKVTAWGETTDIPVDSIIYSLFGKELDHGKDTLWIGVQIMGARKDYDRKFKVEVVADSCDGIEGKDFEVLQPTYIFHANRGTDVFPLILNKKSLEGVLSHSVLLRLKATDDLGVAYEEYSTLKVNYSAYLSEPDWWWAFSYYLGDYHPLKYEKVIEVYGSSEVDPYGNNPYCIYVANIVVRYFEENEVIDPFTGERIVLI